jgi:polyisoprenoid-binding protein YceI
MRVSGLIFAFAVCACATASGAPDQPPPFTAPVSAQADYPVAVDLPAGVYRLDPRHATVLFRIRHMGLAWLTARFDGEAASLTLDPADPSRSQLRASVDADTVNTGVLNAQGERAFDRSIARALGEETTPTISFVSSAIERTGEHTARVTGGLTMNGQTHPAAFQVTFDGAAVDPLRGGATVLGFSAHGAINRSEWDVNEWRAFAGDEVQIVIEAEFVKG